MAKGSEDCGRQGMLCIHSKAIYGSDFICEYVGEDWVIKEMPPWLSAAIVWMQCTTMKHMFLMLQHR